MSSEPPRRLRSGRPGHARTRGTRGDAAFAALPGVRCTGVPKGERCAPAPGEWRGCGDQGARACVVRPGGDANCAALPGGGEPYGAARGGGDASAPVVAVRPGGDANCVGEPYGAAPYGSPTQFARGGGDAHALVVVARPGGDAAYSASPCGGVCGTRVCCGGVCGGGDARPRRESHCSWSGEAGEFANWLNPPRPPVFSPTSGELAGENTGGRGGGDSGEANVAFIPRGGGTLRVRGSGVKTIEDEDDPATEETSSPTTSAARAPCLGAPRKETMMSSSTARCVERSVLEVCSSSGNCQFLKCSSSVKRSVLEVCVVVVV